MRTRSEPEAALAASRPAVPLLAFWRRAPANLQGALWLFMGSVAVTVMFVGVKLLNGEINALQVTFLRAGGGVLFLAPLYLRQNPGRLLTPKRPLAVLSRSVTATVAIALAYYSLARLPLADAQAFAFSSTLFLVPIAAIFLGEKIGPRRWSAAAIGFVGVVVMLRPTGALNLGALAAVGAAFFMAVTLAQVKLLTRDHQPNDVFFWGLTLMAVFSAVPAALVWRTPDWSHAWPLAMTILGGALSQFSYVRAYSVGEAGAIAPVEYTRLILAALLGAMFFDELPDALTYIGGALIVAATLYITIREARLGLKKREAEEARTVR